MSKDFDIHEWLTYQANLNLLNEEEEEWDLEAGPEWNVKELKVGDYWYDSSVPGWAGVWSDFSDVPNILKKAVIKITYIGPYKPKLNKIQYHGKNVVVMERGDEKYVLQLDYFNNEYGPKLNAYIPTNNLNEEEDDEFSQEFIAGPEWNVKDLNVGDVVTPEMWDQEKIKNINDYIINDPDWFEKPHKITKFRPTYLDFVIFDNNKELSLRFVNNFLKPNFKIDFPGLNEQDEDEWEFTAGEEWNEYDGTVVITYVLDSEGYVYIDDDDVEEFDSLNPGALDKFDYNDEPIRETNVYKSKPIHIRDLISKLDELVGIQAQPYTGEKTTKGFKDWMADNGIGIDSLAYLYDILSPTIIKTTYQDDYGNPVKITHEMKNRIDYDGSDIFYGGVIDVKFNDKLTESDDEWDLEAGPEWNVKGLSIGDYITPEMWNKNIYSKSWRKLNQDIKIIGFEKGVSLPEWFVAEYIDSNGGLKQNKVNIDFFNAYVLKPGYEVIPPNKLREQDEDWDFEAGKEWNEKEIKVGDYWYESSNPEWNGVWSNYYDIPDRISDLVLKVIYIGPHKEEFSKPPYNDIPNYYGEYVIISKRNGKFWAFTVNYFNNNFGKRLNAYIPTDNLNEQDNEWDLEAGPEWNEKILKIGDKLTPEMFKDNTTGKHWSTVLDLTIKKIDWKHGKLTYIAKHPDGDKNIGQWDLKWTERELNPGFGFDLPLNESDDEWDLEAGPEWNEILLSLGDKITPDMWDEKAVIDAGEEDEFLEGETWTIIEIDNTWISIKSNGGGFLSWDIDSVQALLKPQYRIVVKKDLFEEDEWDLEAGPEWNVKDLNVGDIVTPDMWDEDKLRYFEDNISSPLFFTKPHKITRIEKTYFDFVWFDDEKKENLYFSNNLLKPQYRIVQPLNEQEDEDWDFEAGDEWNVTELGIGDIITPDMWRKNLSPEYGNIGDWIDYPNENQMIDEIDTDDNGVVGIWFTGKKSNIQNIYTLMDFNNLLDPKYQIVPPLNEQEENEWDFEAGEEWGVKELTTGDYITPEMWDWQEIGAFIDRMNDGDHEEYRRDWQEWEEGTKNPVKILKIYGHGVSTYPELDSYLFRWGPNIRFINQMLKPEFKVIST